MMMTCHLAFMGITVSRLRAGTCTKKQVWEMSDQDTNEIPEEEVLDVVTTDETAVSYTHLTLPTILLV